LSAAIGRIVTFGFYQNVVANIDKKVAEGRVQLSDHQGVIMYLADCKVCAYVQTKRTFGNELLIKANEFLTLERISLINGLRVEYAKLLL
jgi:hypothetical protein